jgi:hypothetical protein
MLKVLTQIDRMHKITQLKKAGKISMSFDITKETPKLKVAAMFWKPKVMI